MDEWYDVLPCLQYKQLVWYSQCSQLSHAISESHIQHAQWKLGGLTKCAKNGDLEGLRYLVERCAADMHADGGRALIQAIWNGHVQVVTFLVEKGTDVHVYDDYSLRCASECGHVQLVKYLVEKRADVHEKNDYALRLASARGHLEVVRYFVEECGADVHVWDEEPLRWASSYRHNDVVEYLRSKGSFLTKQ